ncbi:MAG: TIGR04076 family protein [Anaerolineae bacterium]|jgi:uncharacterized repeat protein (TIGR04076 family)
MPWSPCKITVLKTMYNEELADQYRRPDVHRGPCPYFTEGQEFVTRYVAERPEGFRCEWAWNDIEKIVLGMMLNADFSTWMQDGSTFIACCTDGIKPVVFKIERVKDG